MVSEDNRPKVDYGCSFLLLLGITIIGLIALNGFVIDAFLKQGHIRLPEWVQSPKINGALRKVAPVAMLVFEYWVFDFFRERLDRDLVHDKDSAQRPKPPQ